MCLFKYIRRTCLNISKLHLKNKRQEPKRRRFYKYIFFSQIKVITKYITSKKMSMYILMFSVRNSENKK